MKIVTKIWAGRHLSTEIVQMRGGEKKRIANSSKFG